MAGVQRTVMSVRSTDRNCQSRDTYAERRIGAIDF
jgi:hypothetical protein